METFNFFISRSLLLTSGQPPKSHSERQDFIEYEFTQGDWHYLDSYTGFTKSAGQEVVRFQGQIIWTNLYCGGMVAGSESLADDTFAFLKTSLAQTDESFQSLRGPSQYEKGDWQYHYIQKGDLTNFWGHEEILFQGKVVFFHHTIGGTIKN